MFLAESILMIEPVGFRMNHQTVHDNKFQLGESPNDRPADALREFVNFRDLLIQNGIEVIVFRPRDESTPDAVFPNNWFSTDPSGRLFLYPMKAENRRGERRIEFIDALKKGDTDLAAKYFVVDKQEEWKNQLADGKKNNHLNLIIEIIEKPKTGKEIYDGGYLYTVIPDKNKVVEFTVSLTKNKATNKWKIEDI